MEILTNSYSEFELKSREYADERMARKVLTVQVSCNSKGENPRAGALERSLSPATTTNRQNFSDFSV